MNCYLVMFFSPYNTNSRVEMLRHPAGVQITSNRVHSRWLSKLTTIAYTASIISSSLVEKDKVSLKRSVSLNKFSLSLLGVVRFHATDQPTGFTMSHCHHCTAESFGMECRIHGFRPLHFQRFCVRQVCIVSETK